MHIKKLILALLLISTSAFAMGGGKIQVPPFDAEIQPNSKFPVNVFCKDGKVVEFKPDLYDNSYFSFFVINPITNAQSYYSEEFKSYLVLNFLNPPLYYKLPSYDYKKLSPLIQIKPDGEFSIRTSADQEFFLLGTLNIEPLQKACLKTTDASIEARCSSNQTPGWRRDCFKDWQSRYARDGVSTELILTRRPEIKFAVERRYLSCGIFPQIRKREYYANITISDNEREIRSKELHVIESISQNAACDGDGWEDKPGAN